MHTRIVFLHPDLGIGGAERLVVDTALAVSQEGYTVQMVTNHHDKSHCFEETKKKELNVTVVADWFPRSLFGRMVALFAYLRMLFGALYILITCDQSKDVVFVDQISVPLPLFWLCGFKTIFYCHFPDQLLTDREHWCKRLYRFPIDYIEEWTTGFADRILVNSKFTATVIRETFRSLSDHKLLILYPVPNEASLQLPSSVIDRNAEFSLSGDRVLCRQALSSGLIPPTARFIFVSINRFERKKNLQLALFALSHLFLHWNELVDVDQTDHSEPAHVHLVVAGGYDSRVTENVEYHDNLVHLADKLKVSDHVTFLRSCSSEIKTLLIASSDAVLYTPAREHFGIVPIEAMFMGRPVIALNSGGPRETVKHGLTGYLCSDENVARLPQLFAESMARLINDNTLVLRMGLSAQHHVSETFSFEAFKTQICDIISDLVTS